MFENKKFLLTIFALLLIGGSFLFAKKLNPSLFNWQSKKVEDLDNFDNEELVDAYLDEVDEGENKNEFKFLFFGDVMLDRNVAKILESKTLSDLLSGLRETGLDHFANKDIISANLEGAVTNNGAHYSPVNLYDFAFKSEHVKEFKEYNFNYFALANNHFSDQGKLGIDETRDNLKAMDFYFSGSADAKIDDFSRTDIEIDGQKVAMISLSMVYNHFDKIKALDLVSKAKEETQLVLINIHWGNEYQHFFNKYQQEVAYYLIGAGADIIVGHHPHVVQGMEVYEGVPIFYSLGNFIFDQYFSPETQEGLALDLVVSSENIKIKLMPHRSIRSAPRFMDDSERVAFFTKYSLWSEVSEEIKEELKLGELVIKREQSLIEI